jgi:hypothetical protein
MSQNFDVDISGSTVTNDGAVPIPPQQPPPDLSPIWTVDRTDLPELDGRQPSAVPDNPGPPPRPDEPSIRWENPVTDRHPDVPEWVYHTPPDTPTSDHMLLQERYIEKAELKRQIDQGTQVHTTTFQPLIDLAAIRSQPSSTNDEGGFPMEQHKREVDIGSKDREIEQIIQRDQLQPFAAQYSPGQSSAGGGAAGSSPYYTPDGGATWYHGMYHTTDGGETWRLNDKKPMPDASGCLRFIGALVTSVAVSTGSLFLLRLSAPTPAPEAPTVQAAAPAREADFSPTLAPSPQVPETNQREPTRKTSTPRRKTSSGDGVRRPPPGDSEISGPKISYHDEP